MNLWFQKQLQHCRIYDDFEYHMEMYQDPFQMVIYSEPLLVYLFLKDLSSGKLPSEDLRKEASFHEDHRGREILILIVIYTEHGYCEITMGYITHTFPFVHLSTLIPQIFNFWQSTLI